MLTTKIRKPVMEKLKKRAEIYRSRHSAPRHKSRKLSKDCIVSSLRHIASLPLVSLFLLIEANRVFVVGYQDMDLGTITSVIKKPVFSSDFYYKSNKTSAVTSNRNKEILSAGYILSNVVFSPTGKYDSSAV